MAYDPDTQAVLDMIRMAGRPPLETLTPAEARVAVGASRAVLASTPLEMAEVRDTAVPGPLGPIPVRLYRPLGTEATDILPVLIFFHGGGWVVGDLDSHDTVCRRFADRAKCRVVAVDYRMAPEHVFPAAVNDCAAVTQWVHDRAPSLGIDPTKIAVGGDSAGGNLAAVMALMARDGTLPKLAYQVLIYPATDMTMTSVSAQAFGPGLVLTTATMKWFIDHYIQTGLTDWRASPLRVASVAGTAPALVLTCAHDPLRDEGMAYAQRLEREGVRVVHMHMSDQIHGFITWGRMVRAADTTIDALARILHQTLWPPGPVV
jgi:acetyl esterase